MCDFGHEHPTPAHYGFLVDTPEIRALVEETQRLTETVAETPIHDHLAWGLIGVYRGVQDETVYRRLDDGRDESRATLEVARRQTVKHGQFYTLLPPLDDIHYVKTVSDTPSISIHLLANDTACVTRHRFDATSGVVTPFRSGYSNAKCPATNGH